MRVMQTNGNAWFSAGGSPVLPTRFALHISRGSPRCEFFFSPLRWLRIPYEVILTVIHDDPRSEDDYDLAEFHLASRPRSGTPSSPEEEVRLT
jgi:hypothetical protein